MAPIATAAATGQAHHAGPPTRERKLDIHITSDWTVVGSARTGRSWGFVRRVAARFFVGHSLQSQALCPCQIAGFYVLICESLCADRTSVQIRYNAAGYFLRGRGRPYCSILEMSARLEMPRARAACV